MSLTLQLSVSQLDDLKPAVVMSADVGIAEAGHKPGESIVCTGKIKHAGSSYIKDWEFLKSLVPANRVNELKVTLPAPEWYHLRYKQGRAYPKAIYANDAEYFADIAAAYRTELQILYDAGCRNITIDDPNLACKRKKYQWFNNELLTPCRLLL